jgi:starch phosphorylase
MIFSKHFSKYEPGAFEALRQALLTGGDRFMHLADLKAYLGADEKLTELYGRRDEWARKVILNVAASGKFSSDRTIGQYANEIWGVKGCVVG